MRRPQRAHPRSRGDHVAASSWSSRYRGSSPLARGPHDDSLLSASAVGLIPARAGTTALASSAVASARAHPRSRGDHFLVGDFDTRRWGSSPLARGPRFTGAPEGGRPGLIPARAGTTLHLSRLSYFSWAHPRSRGDHPHLTYPPSRESGSSPLARGPLLADALLSLSGGLIPARAGTT